MAVRSWRREHEARSDSKAVLVARNSTRLFRLGSLRALARAACKADLLGPTRRCQRSTSDSQPGTAT
eukprot:1700829-Alexandrium_andersonii.AAC.1